MTVRCVLSNVSTSIWNYRPNSTWLVMLRLDTTRHVRRRARREVRVEPCLFQHGGQRRSSSARLHKFSLLCTGHASISKTTSGKEVRCTRPPQSTLWRRPWTRVVRVALVVTSVSRRTVWQARLSRHVLSRHVTTFPHSKMHGLGFVSCGDITWRAKWNLGLYEQCSLSGSSVMPHITPLGRYGSIEDTDLDVICWPPVMCMSPRVECAAVELRCHRYSQSTMS